MSHEMPHGAAAAAPPFCPLIPAWLLEAMLADGRYRETIDGFEKRCSRCRDWFPADTEFFKPRKDRSDDLDGRCRACQIEVRHGHPSILPLGWFHAA